MVLTGADKVDMKVVLLGKEYGGKTSLAERYLRNHFNGHMPYQSVRTNIFALEMLFMTF